MASTAASSVSASIAVAWPKGLNVGWFRDVNRFAKDTAWAHDFMHAYALWLGVTLLAAAVVCSFAVGWWRRDARTAALVVLGAAGTVAALGLNQLVGHATAELRPYATLPHVLVLVGRTGDYAFPSDHAVAAGGLLMTVLVVCVHLGRRASTVALGTATVLLALFLAFARVYVGAHFPGDVVAGLLLGSLVAGVVLLVRPLAYRLVDGVGAGPLAVVVRRPGNDDH